MTDEETTRELAAWDPAEIAHWTRLGSTITDAVAIVRCYLTGDVDGLAALLLPHKADAEPLLLALIGVAGGAFMEQFESAPDPRTAAVDHLGLLSQTAYGITMEVADNGR